MRYYIWLYGTHNGRANSLAWWAGNNYATLEEAEKQAEVYLTGSLSNFCFTKSHINTTGERPMKA